MLFLKSFINNLKYTIFLMALPILGDKEMLLTFVHSVDFCFILNKFILMSIEILK